MTTTPSGLTVEEAEALSRQQQEQIKAGMPKEGEVFAAPIGEGAHRLGVIQGGQLYWIDTNEFKPGTPGNRDWQGSHRLLREDS